MTIMKKTSLLNKAMMKMILIQPLHLTIAQVEVASNQKQALLK